MKLQFANKKCRINNFPHFNLEIIFVEDVRGDYYESPRHLPSQKFRTKQDAWRYVLNYCYKYCLTQNTEFLFNSIYDLNTFHELDLENEEGKHYRKILKRHKTRFLKNYNNLLVQLTK